MLTVTCSVCFLLFWTVLQIYLPQNDPTDDHLCFDSITEFGLVTGSLDVNTVKILLWVNWTLYKLHITSMQKDQAEKKNENAKDNSIYVYLRQNKVANFCVLV